MNTRAILVTAVILAFIAGFMSAELIVQHGNTENKYTVVEASNIKVIPIEDREYYPVVIEKINNANVSIHIVMFEMKWYGNPDKDTHKVSALGRALVAAEKRGVDVKIILDDGKGYGFENPQMVEWAQNWKAYFESHHIQVKFDWSNQTTHDKLVIIDHKIVIVGSTNWSTSALDYNHEADAIIESKEVAQQYENYFNSLWNVY